MLDLVDLPPVTRATTLRATNDVRMIARPTIGRGDMVRTDARALGAISAPNVRMGSRARAAAVKAAPRRWATTTRMDSESLARARAERDARIADRAERGDPRFA